MIYLVVSLGSVAINLLTTPARLWFVGLVVFWGLGVLAHTLTIFVFDRHFGGAWERAQVEKILGRPL